MKALILSGGKGTRLRPLTHTRAKQLIPVANKPTLFYGIESIAAAGIKDIGIVVGDTRSEIEAAVGDGGRWGVRLTIILQSAPKGLAHAVATAQDFLGSDSFVMYLGDNILCDGILPFVQAYQEKKPDAAILLTPVEHPEWFGNAVLNPDGSVKKLEEKPQRPQSNLALVGVYLFTAKIHHAIAKIKPSARGELEITDAISQMIADGNRVDSHRVGGWWKDTGNAEDLIDANRLILERLTGARPADLDASVQIDGPVQVGTGSELKDCKIRGPVVIGEHSQVSDSYIGPFTSIGHHCRLEHCEIEHSIVMNHCEVYAVGQRIESSILGEQTRLSGAAKLPRSHRLVLGDRCEVILSQ